MRFFFGGGVACKFLDAPCIRSTFKQSRNLLMGDGAVEVSEDVDSSAGNVVVVAVVVIVASK